MPYVDAGYFLDDYINEAFAPRSLGDDGGVRRRFWQSKRDEWVQERLEAMAEAVGGTAKARKRVARTTEAQAAFKAIEWPDMAPRLDLLDRLSKQLVQPQPDYAALEAAIADHIATLAAEAKRKRRARDEAAMLLLMG